MKQFLARIVRWFWWLVYARWTGEWVLSEQWDKTRCNSVMAGNRWGGLWRFWSRDVDGLEWFGNQKPTDYGKR